MLLQKARQNYWLYSRQEFKLQENKREWEESSKCCRSYKWDTNVFRKHLAYYFLHFSVKNTNRSVGFIIEGNTKLLNLYHLVCRSQSEYSEHQEWVTLWMGYTRKRVNRFNDVGRQGRSVLEEKHKTFDGYSKSLTVLILGKIISGTTNFNN